MKPQSHLPAVDRTPDANWLLRTLIFISLAVHAVVFIHVSGIYRSTALSCIEMSLQDISKPGARAIPRSRSRPKPPEVQDQVKKIAVVKRPLPRFRPLVMAPVESNLPDSLVEGISAPDMPKTPGVDSSDWVPGPQAHEAADEFMTAASYLDMVRLKIERRKRYPETAKARSIEGRVAIRFVLATDGSVHGVAVIKGSRNTALNMAALDAVQRAAPFPRPPSKLFEGELPLELTIVFELT